MMAILRASRIEESECPEQRRRIDSEAQEIGQDPSG